MSQDQRIMLALGAAIDEINSTLPAERRLEKGAETALVGAGGRLDSMGLVNLVVAAEEAIESEFGVGVNLGDSRAMSETPSPFRSVGTLAEYVARLLREQGHG